MLKNGLTLLRNLNYNDETDPNKGVRVIIVLKRRIINSILTIYLPTFLVLCIVYATNFFKDFFFEAQVTVNLTSLLVLTTLFISVSSSLPATAYIKMVDIWLIFAQLVPWIEVKGNWLNYNNVKGSAPHCNRCGKS